MKKSKRIFASCLVCLLVATLGSACQQERVIEEVSEYYEDVSNQTASGGNVNSNSAESALESQAESGGKPEGPSGQKVTTTHNKTASTTAASGQKIDLKGATVTVTAWGAGAGPIKTEASYKEETAFNAALEKKYNFKFKFETVADAMQYADTVTTKLMSGVKYGDIIYIPSSLSYPKLPIKGYVHPLDAYIDFSLPQWNKIVNEYTTYNGKHYATTNEAFGAGFYTIFFNKSLFQKFGVTSPYEYFQKNNWTWDTFLQAAKATTKKEGDIQYWGMGSDGAKPTAPLGFIFSNGGSPVRKENGKEVFNLDTEAAIEAIDFAGRLYNSENVCEKKPADAALSYYEAQFKKGRIAMFVGPSYNAPTYLEALGKNMGFVYMPRGPKAKSHYSDTSEIPTYYIPTVVKNPKEIAAVLTEWLSPQSWRMTKEEEMEPWFSDSTALKIALDMGNNARVENMFSYYGDYTDKVVWSDMGIFSKTPARSYVASVKQMAQKSIDNTWAGK